MGKSRSCDTCAYLVRIKNLKGWQGRLGICEEDDGSIDKVIKNCKRYKAKKYDRKRIN